MKKLILLSAVIAGAAGCAATHQWGAETPLWNEHGAVVDAMVRKQVANPNVIANPPSGVVESYDGVLVDKTLQKHRGNLGDAKKVEKSISVGAGARL